MATPPVDTSSAPASPADIDWQQVLTDNQAWLRRVLFSRLGEQCAVDECMQEVGLAAVRQAAPIRDTSKVGPWLYQLAVRQALLYRRKMGRKRNLIQRYADRKKPVESDEGVFDPANWLMAKEKVAMVQKALAELKDSDREILLLKYSEEWSYQQISDHLKVTHSAVEARLHRLAKDFGNLLKEWIRPKTKVEGFGSAFLGYLIEARIPKRFKGDGSVGTAVVENSNQKKIRVTLK